MMNAKKIIKDLQAFSTDISSVEKMLIYVFLRTNQIDFVNSPLLAQYLSGCNLNVYEKAYSYFSANGSPFSLPSLVELFEILVPFNEKKEKGVVYTPAEIKDFIIAKTMSIGFPPHVVDPSCGCGSFLVSAADYIHSTYHLQYKDIIENYLYGVDIEPSAIMRAKVLLSILLCVNHESGECKFNLFCGDMLSTDTVEMLQNACESKFDCVIGNPPYVRARNMNEASKSALSNWKTSQVGNVDLYIPFFEVGISLLKKVGRLGFITPNGYLQAVNGRQLRRFLTASGHSIKIVDFRDAQVFRNVTSYTCVTIIDTANSSSKIEYTRLNDENTLNNHVYSTYEMDSFPNGAPWRMRKNDVDEVVEKLESSGRPLSTWKIRNGLATLKNDLFFFNPSTEDDKYYYRSYDGAQFKIEKDICIAVAKPNIIKSEEELVQKSEVAIFPYTIDGDRCTIIDEHTLAADYPYAYKFLCAHKSDLEMRDKGHGNYPAWYAYGRTQGMNNFGKKLLIPYIAGSPIAVLSLNERLLFYCGYALIADDEEELRILKCFLESDAFWYYIFHTSKPYSKGYMAFAKNYITNFSIPDLSEDEKSYLLSNPEKYELNRWIWSKYGLVPHAVE